MHEFEASVHQVAAATNSTVEQTREAMLKVLALYDPPLPAGPLDDLAKYLRQQAEVARTSPYGQHPQISIRTHAAALRWAADQAMTVQPRPSDRSVDERTFSRSAGLRPPRFTGDVR